MLEGTVEGPVVSLAGTALVNDTACLRLPRKKMFISRSTSALHNL